MNWKQALTYHGQTKSVCEWVINTYDNREEYNNNETVSSWIYYSKQCLKDKYGISSTQPPARPRMG